jgi:hypothetical protein
MIKVHPSILCAILLLASVVIAAESPVKSVDMPIEYGHRRNDGEWSIISWKTGMVFLILVAFVGNLAFLRNACFSK